MKKLTAVLGSLLFLTACASTGLVYENPPAQIFQPQHTLQMHVRVKPINLYFTAVILQAEQTARLIVLGDMGIKLLDLQVTPRRARVYYKMARLPDSLAGAFARMAQQELLAEVSPSVLYQDAKTKLVFEGQLAGDEK